MNEKIIERILRNAEIPDLLEALTNRLTLSDLQSLLLEVYRRRAKALTSGHLLKQYEQNRFVQPAKVSPQKLLEFDRVAYALLPAGFEVIELSPVCPLGATSIVAPVDQNNAVTTIRNSEVCSDSTNVLALECARRRRASRRDKSASPGEIKLCASHRLLRAQTFDSPASFPHFRIFSLCTAGRDKGSYTFEIASLIEHIEFYAHLLAELKRTGYPIGGVRVCLVVFDPTRYAVLEAAVSERLSTSCPRLDLGFVQEYGDSQGYYAGVRFQIYATDLSGTEYFLVDGGFTDWTQQLLSDRKERLLISGMGSERTLFCFTPC